MGLPPETNKIDAVYERKSDSHIIFFIGKWQNSKVKLAWTGTNLKKLKSINLKQEMNQKSDPGTGNLSTNEAAFEWTVNEHKIEYVKFY